MCPAYAYLDCKVRGRLVKEMSAGHRRTKRGSGAAADGQTEEEEQGGAGLSEWLAALAEAVKTLAGRQEEDRHSS